MPAKPPPNAKQSLMPTPNQVKRLNRALLAMCFFALLFFALFLFNVKIDVLILFVSFLAPVLLYFFPEFKHLPDYPWLQSLRTSAILLIIFAVFYTGGIILWTRQQTTAATLAQISPTQTLVAQTQTAIAITPTPASSATPAPTLAPQKSELAIALAGVKYRYGEWNPRSIDLTSSASDGIPLSRESPTIPFELFDVQVNILHSGSNLEAQVELYAGSTFLGSTAKKSVNKGVNDLGEVSIKSDFRVSPNKNALLILPSWNEIQLVSILTRNKEVLADSGTLIKFSSGGQAWYLEPPYASIVEIDYKLNAANATLLDLHGALNGINAQTGDTLSIEAIWVRSRNEAPKRTVHAEGYLTSCANKTYDETSLISLKTETAVQQGIYAIQGNQKMIWDALPADKDCLILSVLRDDDAVMDRYEIPLKSSYNPALYQAGEVMPVDLQSTQYLDFEQGDNLDGWSANEGTQLDIWSIPSFSGKRSLAVKTSATGPQTYFWKNLPKNPSFIIGQIYWPSTAGINVKWALICESFYGQCASVPVKMGQWNSFSFSLTQIRGSEKPDQPVDRSKIASFFIRADISGNSPEKIYTFLIDDLTTFYDRP